jgi:hypothetical protein
MPEIASPLFALFIVVVSLLSIVIIWGWGQLVRADVWSGLGVVLAVLIVWHFVLPISALTTFVIGGIGGLAAARALYQRGTAAVWLPRTSGNLLFLLPFALLLALVGLIATGFPTHGDSGLYHVHTVAWNTAYPVTPGLGNLHMRLGYNSIYLLFASLYQPLPGGATHYPAVVFIALLMFESFAAWRIAGRRLTITTLFSRLFIIAVMFACIAHDPRNLSTDLPVLVTGLLLTRSLLAALNASHLPEIYTALRAGLVFAALSIVFKLSAVVFAASTVIVLCTVTAWHVFQVWHAQSRGTPPDRWAMLIPATLRATFGLCILLGILWSVRGVVLSGHLVYPVSATALPVDWQVPEAIAREDTRTITAYARNPTPTMNQTPLFSQWFPVWWSTFARSFTPFLLLLMLTISGTLAVYTRVRGWHRHASAFTSLSDDVPQKMRWQSRALFFLLPFAAGFFFWFVNAPDPRFGSFLFWGVGLAALAFALRPFPTGVTIIVVLIMIAPAVYLLPVLQPRRAALPPQLVSFTTSSGLTLYTPEVGMCWAAELLCTPFPDTDIALRGDGLGSGFRPYAPAAPP